jgi:hypothetical protein
LALKAKHSNGNGAGMPLSIAVKLATDWPTPLASENENRQTKASPSQLAGEHGWSLGAAVNHPWPTPTTTEGKGPTRGANAQGGMGLSETVRMFPTPRVSIGTDCPSERARKSPGLDAVVASSWPTPSAADDRPRGNSESAATARRLAAGGRQTNLSMTVPGALSPAWVCRLMGFPDGWTITSGPPAVAKRSTPASPRARRRASP